MADLTKVLGIAGSGIKAESDRIRVISQNIANADSTAQQAGGLPYRRKTIEFKDHLDKELGVHVVKVSRYSYDRSDYNYKFDPGHPAANADGYVAFPNVDIVIEQADLKEAQRTYQANLGVIDTTKTMLSQTLGLLRNN